MASTEAFHQAADTYRDRIYSFSYYYLGRGEDAEDVTQEVLVRLWNHMDNVDPFKLSAWVSRVTRNACIDFVRKKMTYRNVVADDDFDTVVATIASSDPGPAAQLDSADRRTVLMDTLNAMAEPYRSVLLLREIQQASYNEIADSMDMPLNTVKVYIHRGRRKLREQLMETCLHDAC